VFKARPNKFSIKIRGGKWIGEEDTQVGRRYALEREIGRGGVGVVLLARDTQLERWVALKRLQAEAVGFGERAQAALAEAKRLARLQHPNIVTVYDVLEHQGDVLIVMEYLSGYTLEELKHPLPLEDFLQVARQSLAGLGAAHALDLIHLDIKSTNIMLTWLPTGHIQLKLLDFGLAAIMERPSLQTLDDSGSLLGSVYTMAPEQFEQNPVGAHTDIYSLGCVFYHALTRQEPFEGATTHAVMEAHLNHTVQPLAEKRPDLPASVCSWVESLMARSPSDRPADARAAMAGLLTTLAAFRPRNIQPSSEHKNSPLFGRRAGDRAPAPVADTPNGQGTRPEALDLANPAELVASMGKEISVEAVVDRVWENSQGTIRFLNFMGIEHNTFSVLLKTSDPGLTNEYLKSLIGRKIRVTGKLSDFHGCPQIVVQDALQIKVLEAAH